MTTGAGRDRRATVIDVAAAAGVSRQTVTRAMNDMAGISAATKQRVLQAAKDLKYRPSRFGRGLVVGHQLTLGLVVEDLTNPYFPELAAGVVESATARGWNVLVADGAHRPDDPQSFLRSLTGEVDAIVGYIRVPPVEFDDVFGDLPVVALEGDAEAGSRGVVSLDFGPGFDLAVDHLERSGRQTIVMVDAGTRAEPSARSADYVAAMRRRGLEPHVFFEPEGDGAADRVVREIQGALPEVDAMIAFNDLHAFGLIKAAQRAGLDVPARCAVLGVDGLSMGVVSSPELSSLDLDIEAVGRVAVELVTGIHAGDLPPSGPEVQRVVSHTLLLRESA
jgi:DNA-binding LacI/PurR family transcriptional regulator